MVGDSVVAKSYYNYKTDFKFGNKIRSLSAKRMQVVEHLWTRLLLVQKLHTKRKPPLDSAPIGKKTSDPKTPTIDLTKIN